MPKNINWLWSEYHYSWIVSIIIITAGILIVTIDGYSMIPNDATSYFYLLSTISQVLAALFGLIFAISLVAIQIASKYTQRLITFAFSGWIIPYIVFFIISILYPLFLLNSPLNIIHIRLSLLFTITCIALIIPFLTTILMRLNINSMINQLSHKAVDSSIKGACLDPAELTVLDNIAMGAYTARDFDTFKCAVYAIRDVFIRQNNGVALVKPIIDRLEIITSKVSHDDTAADFPITAIKDIQINLLHNFSDSHAIEDIHASSLPFMRLHNIARRANQLNAFDVTELAVKALEEICLKAVETDAMLVVSPSLTFLVLITIEAYQINKTGYTAGRTTKSLVHIGVKAMECGRTHMLNDVYNNIFNLHAICGSEFVEQGCKYAYLGVPIEKIPKYLEFYDGYCKLKAAQSKGSIDNK